MQQIKEGLSMKQSIRGAITGLMALAIVFAAASISQPVGAVSGICDDPQDDGLVWYIGGPTTKAGWMDPGAVYEGQIEACNANSAGRKISVSSSPYSVSQSDYIGIDFISKNSWNMLADWISFPSGDSYEIASGQTIYIPFKITVPSDGSAIAGSQAAMIMLEGGEIYGSTEQSSLLSTKRFGWAVFADINGADLHQSGQIEQWKADGPLLLDNRDGLNVFSLMENTGNVSFNSRHELVITDLLRDKVVYENQSEMSILPESKRANEQKWDQLPALGLYKVQEQISYLDQSVPHEAIVLVVPLWLLIIIAMIIILLVAAIVIKVREHRKSTELDDANAKE
jgi:hypothetical protein